MYWFLGVGNESYDRKDGKHVSFHEIYLAESATNGIKPILVRQQGTRADGQSFDRTNKGFYVRDGHLLDVLPGDWQDHTLDECDVRFAPGNGGILSITFLGKGK